MVNAAKTFEKEPPREPLTSLRAIHEDFLWRYKDREKTDQVVEYCRQAEDFPTAVRIAVESRDAQGKHHNHQSKVDINARRKFGRRIIRQAQRGALPMTDFDELHDALDEIKPYGIGPVTVYDVATRIGAFLGIEPTSVYMHAGVRQGFNAMVYALDRIGHPKADWFFRNMRRDKVPVNNFPRPWDRLPADDVEDMLCTYRGVFDSWQGE